MDSPKTILSKLGVFLGIFTSLLFFFLSYGIIHGSSDSSDSLFNNFKTFSEKYFSKSKNNATSSDKLQGEDLDRVNILLLGMGGDNHDGGDLTDTIITASYKPSAKQLAFFSLPRDLLVYLPDYGGWRKINNVHSFAKQENPETSSEKTTQFISQMLEIPIDYYVKVNFNGFKQVIDALGGLDVYVENTLEDELYPIKGNENVFPLRDRYEHLFIEKGWQHMDGSLALKYARSRHAQGAEGSDYARSRRQQKIIIAAKEKILSFQTIINPSLLLKLWNIFNDNVETNLGIKEIYRGAALARLWDQNNIITKVIDASPDGPLIERTYDGAFVLETKTGDFSEVQFIANNIFDSTLAFDKSKRKYVMEEKPLATEVLAVSVTREESPTSLSQNKLAKIEIQNGTLIQGMGSAKAEELRTLGFNILQISNAEEQNYKKTQILKLTSQENPEAEKILKNYLKCDILGQLSNLNKTDADYLLILGSDLLY